MPFPTEPIPVIVPAPSLISEAHRAKAARVAERILDDLAVGRSMDAAMLSAAADAVYKLDLVSRGPVSR